MNEKQYTDVFFVASVVLIVTTFIFLSGCASIPLTCEDQSRATLDRCNQDCGEGFGATLCKTACTSSHQDRLQQCDQIN